MLEHIFEGHTDDPAAVTIDMVERFKEEYRVWMADGTHTPFSTMIRWMSYGKGFRQLEGGVPRVLMEEGGDTLRYLGERISIADFQETATKGIDEAEAGLDWLIFGG